MGIEINVQHRSLFGRIIPKVAVLVCLAGVILSGVVFSGFSLYRTSAVMQTTREIATLVDKVRTIHGSVLSVDRSLSEKAMALAGLLPPEMITPADQDKDLFVHNAWGGAVSVEAKSVRGRNDSFTISYAKMPIFVCVALLTKLSGEGRDPGLVGIANAFTYLTPMPLTIEEATDICSAQSGGERSLVLTYTLLRK